MTQLATVTIEAGTFALNGLGAPENLLAPGRYALLGPLPDGWEARPAECPDCDGTGEAEDAELASLQFSVAGHTGADAYDVCYRCGGSGVVGAVVYGPCDECNGWGDCDCNQLSPPPHQRTEPFHMFGCWQDWDAPTPDGGPSVPCPAGCANGMIPAAPVVEMHYSKLADIYYRGPPLAECYPKGPRDSGPWVVFPTATPDRNGPDLTATAGRR